MGSAVLLWEVEPLGGGGGGKKEERGGEETQSRCGDEEPCPQAALQQLQTFHFINIKKSN